MATKDETKVEGNATESKQEATTEKRAMKIRLKTGVTAGPSTAASSVLIAVHL